MKTFLIRKMAIKYAEEELCLTTEDYDIEEFLPEGKARKMYRIKAKEDKVLPEPKPKPKKEEPPSNLPKLKVVDKTENEQECGICGRIFHSDEFKEGMCLECYNDHASAPPAVLPEPPAVIRSRTTGTGVEINPSLVKVTKQKIARTNKSTIDSPTKMVWHIADEMIEKNPQVSRKAVIAECVNRGIAFFTARTQYQQWLTARRESMANAARANGNK